MESLRRRTREVFVRYRLLCMGVLVSFVVVGCSSEEDSPPENKNDAEGGIASDAGPDATPDHAASTDSAEASSGCSNDTDCAADQVCQTTVCAASPCPRACLKKVGDCTMSACGPDAFCKYGDSNEKRDYCVPRAGQGEPCADQPSPHVNTCQDGLFCKEAETLSAPGRCVKSIPAGQSCPQDGLFVCESGYACRGAFGSSPGTCEKIAQLNEVCNGTFDCGVGLVCDTYVTSRCKAQSSVGGQCYPQGGSYNEYDSGWCEMYLMCVLPKAPGDCASAADCPQLHHCCAQADGTGQCSGSMSTSCYPPAGTCQPR